MEFLVVPVHVRYIITSDIHIHPFKECSKDGGLDRLEDGAKAVEQTLEYARKYHAEWWCLGDLKQVPGVWPQDALNTLYDLLSSYSDVEKVLLAGNGGHDGRGKHDLGKYGLVPFEHIPNTTIVGDPVIRRSGKHAEVACWPWRPTLDELPAFLRQAREAGVRTLVGHGSFLGASVGPDDYRPQGFLDPAQFWLAGKRQWFTTAFFGDLHKQQTLRPGATIYYSGSPYAQNWGEREEKKWCLLAERTRDGWNVRRLRVKGPRFIRIDCTDRNWRRSLAQHASEVRGHFVDVVLSADFGKTSVVERWAEENGVRFLKKTPAPAKDDAPTESPRTFHAALPLATVLQRWTKRHRPPKGTSRREALHFARTLGEV